MKNIYPRVEIYFDFYCYFVGLSEGEVARNVNIN